MWARVIVVRRAFWIYGNIDCLDILERLVKMLHLVKFHESQPWKSSEIEELETAVAFNVPDATHSFSWQIRGK